MSSTSGSLEARSLTAANTSTERLRAGAIQVSRPQLSAQSVQYGQDLIRLGGRIRLLELIHKHLELIDTGPAAGSLLELGEYLGRPGPTLGVLVNILDQGVEDATHLGCGQMVVDLLVYLPLGFLSGPLGLLLTGAIGNGTDGRPVDPRTLQFLAGAVLPLLGAGLETVAVEVVLLKGRWGGEMVGAVLRHALDDHT